MAEHKHRTLWAAPDIQFDADGRRIRPGKKSPAPMEACRRPDAFRMDACFMADVPCGFTCRWEGL